MTVRTRFAPSPTGYLHIGGVRTALVLLAVRPAARRPVHPADRRHRSAAERRRGAGADPARAALAGDRLGRGPGGGRPVRSLLSVAAAAIAIRRRSKSSWPAGRPTTTTPRPRNSRPSARRPSARSGRSSTAAASWPRRRPIVPASRPRAGRPVVRLKMPREGTLVIDDLVRGRVEVAVGPRAGPRHPAGRRHLPLSPGQRGGRLRFPDHARHPRRRASFEHAAAGLHRPVAGLSHCRSTPICRSWPSRAARTSSASGSSTSI